MALYSVIGTFPGLWCLGISFYVMAAWQGKVTEIYPQTQSKLARGLPL